MATVFAGDVVRIDGHLGRVEAAQMQEDDAQWLQVSFRDLDHLVPIIISLECYAPRDWQGYLPDTYHNSHEIAWEPASLEINPDCPGDCETCEYTDDCQLEQLVGTPDDQRRIDARDDYFDDLAYGSEDEEEE